MFSVALLNTSDQSFIPTQTSLGSAGYTILSRISTSIAPGTSQSIPVGVAINIPSDHYAHLAPLTDLATNNGIGILGGIIDSSFRDEIEVNLINYGTTPFVINVGDQVAQIIFERINIPALNVVDYSNLSTV